MDYNELIERLRSGVVEVTFNKVDGTQRVMTCTLLPEYLPEEDRNSQPMLTEAVGNAISVWDVNANGWRSFRFGSVTKVV